MCTSVSKTGNPCLQSRGDRQGEASTPSRPYLPPPIPLPPSSLLGAARASLLPPLASLIPSLFLTSPAPRLPLPPLIFHLPLTLSAPSWYIIIMKPFLCQLSFRSNSRSMLVSLALVHQRDQWPFYPVGHLPKYVAITKKL